MPNKKKKLKIKLNYIDLFCGIGGFHQALSKLGHRCILACDIDKDCRKVYKDNYGIEPVEDVREIDPNKIKENIDIICGGFPCQAFSNAGKKKTFSDERGLLFDEIIRIAQVKKPMFMFLENVKHILKVGNGEVIKYIKQKIDDTGYNLQIFNMSPHDYGIPQQRERVYFVCVRKDIYKKDVTLLDKKTSEINFKTFLDKKENIDKKYFITGDTLEALNAWEEIIKEFDKGEKISPTIMVSEAIKYSDVSLEKLNELNKYSENLKKYDKNIEVLIKKCSKELEESKKIFKKYKDFENLYTEIFKTIKDEDLKKEIEIEISKKEIIEQEIENNNYCKIEREFIDYADWRRDYIIKNKPLYEKYKEYFDQWYNENEDILTKREIYGKLEWQVGKIQENDSIFNYFIQLRQSGIRVKKAKYFPTLVAISQIPIYGKEKRYITPRECIRLQSFPGNFKISENDKITYKQAGNSVNVENVLNVIKSTLKMYSTDKVKY